MTQAPRARHLMFLTSPLLCFAQYPNALFYPRKPTAIKIRFSGSCRLRRDVSRC
ncbi:hypothetical protein BV20DRAFT_975225 [Pilatotrama ljubarskyi]|nr:hypothetical protein BV20DRAFT_975225 [Pilatotrama ljubarskyi]